ncbi:MAG: hypothetical protein U0892_19190 [Pirellulales bacterium]
MPIPGVRVSLRDIDGINVKSSTALAGIYGTENIEVVTDARGFFIFRGLRAGTYSLYQSQPVDFIDGIDTPGSLGGYSVNHRGLNNDPAFLSELDRLRAQSGTDPGFDGILFVTLNPGDSSEENNFSEVRSGIVAPPIESQRANNPRVVVGPETFPRYNPLPWSAPVWEPLPLLLGAGHLDAITWHLSVINAGYPRGRNDGQAVDELELAEQTRILDIQAWQVRGMNQATGRIVSTRPSTKGEKISRMVFDVPGAIPLAGDFNGDGVDELALYVNGEWLVDLNSNGRWDAEDIWLKLGTHEDQPVLGDWDGDGKDDVGIFGRQWVGDERALSAESGLPDPENIRRIKPKNLPPRPDEAPERQRLMMNSRQRTGRADLIDHVFRFGSLKDRAVSGDFNGDGISSIGIYREGKWILDVDGDGLLVEGRDKEVHFGETGDQPLVGDFDGDGIDELAIVRGNQIIVDSNDNGRIDATDQVFLLDDTNGTVIVGDFDGDGRDEPALHSPAGSGRPLEARRNAG